MTGNVLAPVEPLAGSLTVKVTAPTAKGACGVAGRVVDVSDVDDVLELVVEGVVGP